MSHTNLSPDYVRHRLKAHSCQLQGLVHKKHIWGGWALGLMVKTLVKLPMWLDSISIVLMCGLEGRLPLESPAYRFGLRLAPEVLGIWEMDQLLTFLFSLPLKLINMNKHVQLFLALNHEHLLYIYYEPKSITFWDIWGIFNKIMDNRHLFCNLVFLPRYWNTLVYEKCL